MNKKQDLTYIQEDSEASTFKKKDSLKRIKKKLKECQREKGEYLSQAQRARADLINYQKRQEKLIDELRLAGQAKLIVELLPVVDSLDRAVKDNPEIDYLKKQIESVLKNYQLEKIKAEGEKFDPNFHEAIDQLETGAESGTIIEEIQKGYLLRGRVLRPSKVRVEK